MKVIYVAGKYRDKTESDVERNIRYAEAAAIRLWQKGWAVICPHKNTAHFGGLAPDETWLEGDLELIRRCDAVYVLDNWLDSVGAVTEVELADELGKEIIYECAEEYANI